ncbi:hypothetical protein N0V90_011752 [Kalmusia sp. IMI 367209]|nr:hypothetical protein N0V90_011752 [Kalmusia sp. IMI 367209]
MSTKTWDILFTVTNPTASVPDWQPTNWRRSTIQKLKVWSTSKQKADAILEAAHAISSEIRQDSLVFETDNVGHTNLYDKSFDKFRLQAVRREHGWEATVWPGTEDIGWHPDRTGKGKSLEECLGDLAEIIREKWREI